MDDHLHIYNSRGYCWCGVHRDDGLAEAICIVLKKAQDGAAPPAGEATREEEAPKND